MIKDTKRVAFTSVFAALTVAIHVQFVLYKPGKIFIDAHHYNAAQETLRKVRLTLMSYPETGHFHHLKVRPAGADTLERVVLLSDGQIMLSQPMKYATGCKTEFARN